MAKILIKNGRVWDGEGFFYADVLTDGDRIVKIEPDISEKSEFVYDASGKIVSAGLVDAHVHMRVHPTDQFSIQAEMSCFPFGVTAAADAGREYGDIKIIESFMLKNVLFVNVSISNNTPDLERLEAAIERFEDRAIGIKVYFDVNSSEVTDITPLAQICRFAHSKGLLVMVHCSDSPTPMSEILGVLGKGDILTHAYHGGVHTAADDDFASIKAAKARGVIIDAGFAGHIHTDFAIFQRAIEAGALPDTISTDITKFSAYTRGGRYGMTMCMSMAKHMGMSETDIFRAVTSNPAKALGKSDGWGYLQVGRIADIAVLDYTFEGFDLTDKAGNHIKSSKGYRCVLTVSDGQVVYRN